jgi:O-antigen ligase
VHPLRTEAAAALGHAVAAGPALDPVAAREALLRLAAYAAIAWLALQGWRGRERTAALAAVAGAGALIAVYALAARALDLGSVLWLGRAAYDAATGPFVARGAFAAFCGLTMLAAAALALRGDGWQRGAAAAAWLAGAAALLASQSRLGLAAALAAHLLLALLLLPNRRRAAGAAVALIAATALAAAALAVGGRLLDAPEDLMQRVAIWQAGLAALAERPWLGHGLGSFAAAFEPHRPPALAKPVLSAHSGPLEWAVEAGLPAAAAWLAALGLLARRLWQAVRAAPGAPAPAVALCGLLLLALHGSMDVAPQVPAVAALGALLLGLGLAHHDPPARASPAPVRAAASARSRPA